MTSSVYNKILANSKGDRNSARNKQKAANLRIQNLNKTQQPVARKELAKVKKQQQSQRMIKNKNKTKKSILL